MKRIAFILLLNIFSLVSCGKNDVNPPSMFLINDDCYVLFTDYENINIYEKDQLIGYVVNAAEGYSYARAYEYLEIENLGLFYDPSSSIRTSDGSNCFSVYSLIAYKNLDYLLLFNYKINATFIYKTEKL